MEVGELGARAGQLGEIAVDGEGPYTAEYRTHGHDVSRMEGVVLLFGVAKVARRPMLRSYVTASLWAGNRCSDRKRGYDSNPVILTTSFLDDIVP